MRALAKIFSLGLSALLGTALGLALYLSLMIVEAGGSDMLPSVAPGDKLLVLRIPLAEDIVVGDLVVYEAPYYIAEDQSDQLIRRVTGCKGRWIRLNCDASTTQSREVLVEKEELLGKVIFDLSAMKKP